MAEATTSRPLPAQPLLTIAQAASYLNVPERWVADAVRQGRIRHARVGKHVRFKIEYLEEFVASCEQPVTAQVLPFQRDRRRSKL
jgi:excisionase family DNA binding protein